MGSMGQAQLPCTALTVALLTRTLSVLFYFSALPEARLVQFRLISGLGPEQPLWPSSAPRAFSWLQASAHSTMMQTCQGQVVCAMFPKAQVPDSELLTKEAHVQTPPLLRALGGPTRSTPEETPLWALLPRTRCSPEDGP